MKSIASTVLLLWAFAIPATAQKNPGQPAGNLLTNGDFRDRLDGWVIDSYKKQGEARIDRKVVYQGKPTLRLESATADHTMANQTIRVKPNTRYRLTAYARTEGIVFLEKGIDGACIGVRGTQEKSAPFPISSDWREITFDFDSANRTEVEVGPHLGWHASLVAGTAWFADVTLEEISVAENLIRNGDFKKGLESWDTVSYNRHGKYRIDNQVHHRGQATLRLESTVADHTMANQIVSVKPDTRYRITAIAKTKGIVFLEKGIDGARLGIRGTQEKSAPFPPTGDWQEITFDFDSGKRTEVEVGPHLGWHGSVVAGMAWFADVKMEER